MMRQLAHISTPPHCTADFCLIPIGTPTAAISHYIAQVQRLLATSGVKYKMHSAGTTLEGTWEEVTTLIGKVHTFLHEEDGVFRIQSDIRIGTRTDKHQSMEDKVRAVEERLERDGEVKKEE